MLITKKQKTTIAAISIAQSIIHDQIKFHQSQIDAGVAIESNQAEIEKLVDSMIVVQNVETAYVKKRVLFPSRVFRSFHPKH